MKMVVIVGWPSGSKICISKTKVFYPSRHTFLLFPTPWLCVYDRVLKSKWPYNVRIRLFSMQNKAKCHMKQQHLNCRLIWTSHVDNLS